MRELRAGEEEEREFDEKQILIRVVVVLPPSSCIYNTPHHFIMKTNRRLTFKYLFLSILLTLPLILLLLRLHRHHQLPITTDHDHHHHSTSSESSTQGIRIRPGYTSYEAYIQRQVNKTLNPKLRQVWTTRDWDRKINVFAEFFMQLKRHRLLTNHSKALCVGARVGQEVEALRRVGVSDSVGIDLVPYPPLVLEGDFHSQPFENDTFDFEFSNVFDHALYPRKFVSEIARTLRPRGVCVLHVAVSHRPDKYSANDLFSVEPLVEMFTSCGCELVHVRKVDGFGLDTEVIFRKRAAAKIKRS